MRGGAGEVFFFFSEVDIFFIPEAEEDDEKKG